MITDYPFADRVTVRLSFAKALPLYIRVPGWAPRATLEYSRTLDGLRSVRPLDGRNGTVVRHEVESGEQLLTLSLRPHIRLEHWEPQGVSVHRGALMFSLPLEAQMIVRRVNWGISEAAEYNVTTRDRWRFALVVNPAKPGDSLTYQQHVLEPRHAPFNQSGGWPCTVQATVRLLPDAAFYLGEGENVTTTVIKTETTTETRTVEGKTLKTRRLPSPACTGEDGLLCGPPQSVQLVPHGATVLRIGMLPIA